MSWKLRTFLSNERGSAVVEFVALALPLFLPLFIYLNTYAVSSDSQSSFRSLGREMARGFVTSENDEVAGRVTYEIFIKGANLLGYGAEIDSGELTYRYVCSETPCISPNSKVIITIYSSKSKVEISTVEYVSAWA
jgi:hypothetical protein